MSFKRYFMVVQMLFIFLFIKAYSKQRYGAFTELYYLQNNLTNSLVLTYQQKVSNQSIHSYLLVFGGMSFISQNKSIHFNTLFRVNLQTQHVQQLPFKQTQPQPKYSSCGIVIRQKLYIYGGYHSNKMLSNQLWKYDFLTQEWSFLGNSLFLKKCQCIPITKTYINDTLTIVGMEDLYSTTKFKVIEFDITQSQIKNETTINVFNAILIPTKTWDGQQVSSQLRLQSTSKINVSEFALVSLKENEFRVKSFCLIFQQQNKFNMLTDNGIFTFHKNTQNEYDITFIKERNQVGNGELIHCACFDEKTFILTAVSFSETDGYLQYQIEYFYDLTQNGKIIEIVDHSKVSGSFKLFYFFAYDGALVIMDLLFNLSWLEKECRLLAAKGPNVKKCQFEIISCNQGFTGDQCEIQICPGSLQLYDTNDFFLIQIYCSNNGICTANGCQCNQNWTGEDCSVYKNDNCRGNLLDNFLIKNCECKQSITGGNECDVVFCYNDCSGKGTCKQNGKCQCQQGYTGPDCSILEISFKQIG